MTSKDRLFMQEAISIASRAVRFGEVPVGCVIVHGGRIVARAHNRRETRRDPTAHAEMIALRLAARRLGRWRLEGTKVYATLEPCAMCAGALVLARIDRLVYGADDPRAGACGSVFDIVREPRLNHRIEVMRGVLQDECQSVLKEFFDGRRKENGALEQ